mgnify:CR=1 FL=1
MRTSSRLALPTTLSSSLASPVFAGQAALGPFAPGWGDTVLARSRLRIEPVSDPAIVYSLLVHDGQLRSGDQSRD